MSRSPTRRDRAGRWEPRCEGLRGERRGGGGGRCEGPLQPGGGGGWFLWGRPPCEACRGFDNVIHKSFRLFFLCFAVFL